MREHGLVLALFQTLPTVFTAVVSLTIASNFLVDRAFNLICGSGRAP